MKRFPHHLLRPALVAAMIVALAGCGMQAPTGPGLTANGGGTAFGSARADASSAATLFTLLNMPPLLTTGGAAMDPPPSAWYTVGSKSIGALGGSVSGSRYKVTVPPGAVLRSTAFTIQEWNPGVLDFQLTPHGQPFVVPVVVTVDYAGTAADPSSPLYDGTHPTLLWLNTSTGFWEVVVSTDDPGAKRLTAVLTHFSRYAVSRGTAEW